MSLNIKLLAFIFCSTLGVLAQKGKNEEPVKILDKGSIYISSYTPIAYGDNFANKGLELSTGFRLGLNFYFDERFIVGLDYRNIYAENVDKQRLGLYDNTEIHSLNFKGGYRYPINEKFVASATVFVGLAWYQSRSNQNSQSFRDGAVTFGLTTNLTYTIIGGLGIFIAPEFRFDSLKTKAPARIKDFFDNVNYITFSAGIRFTFKNKIYAWELERDRLEREEDAQKVSRSRT